MLNCVSLKEIINEIIKKQRSLIITLPCSVKWSDYEKELDKVSNYKQNLNFKVHAFPTGVNKGDKCYVVHNGRIMGWMEIVGFAEKDFVCTTTDKKWKGKFIERSGPFHYLEEDIPYKGFQGFRYFDLEEYKLQNDIS